MFLLITSLQTSIVEQKLQPKVKNQTSWVKLAKLTGSQFLGGTVIVGSQYWTNPTNCKPTEMEPELTRQKHLLTNLIWQTNGKTRSVRID
jgi:hypothetical protein